MVAKLFFGVAFIDDDYVSYFKDSVGCKRDRDISDAFDFFLMPGNEGFDDLVVSFKEQGCLIGSYDYEDCPQYFIAIEKSYNRVCDYAELGDLVHNDIKTLWIPSVQESISILEDKLKQKTGWNASIGVPIQWWIAISRY
jgi:hypothetical protein